MRALELANRYYDAWANRQGDMTGVPLADDFAFSGPVASFDSAAGFRAMARQAGAMVRNFRVRHSSSTAAWSARSWTGRWRAWWTGP
jgi:hypothetical protein